MEFHAERVTRYDTTPDKALRTQQEDLRRLLVHSINSMVRQIADSSPDAPEGLELYAWVQYPHQYSPDGVHLRVEKQGPMVLVEPRMMGSMEIRDFVGIHHSLPWRLGWNVEERLGVIWVAPFSLDPTRQG